MSKILQNLQFFLFGAWFALGGVGFIYGSELSGGFWQFFWAAFMAYGLVMLVRTYVDRHGFARTEAKVDG